MTNTFTDFTPVQDPERRAIAGAMWTRRVFMALFVLVVVAALADGFGQHESSSTAVAPAATLTLRAPRTVRGGVFFQSHVEVVAKQELKYPSLVLDDGWMEGMQVNSVTPQPPNESLLNGRVQLGYDTIPAGQRLRVWVEFEVNPTNDGRHAYGIGLYNGNKPVTRVQRTITVLP
jgi:hypothetical protein